MANMTFGVNLIPHNNAPTGSNTLSLGNSNYKWKIYATEINGTDISSAALLTSNDINVTSADVNTVFAGPGSGSTASAPDFRALVAADIPDLSATYKTVQTAVSDPTASSDTSSTFIDSISQDANGVITVTKKTVAGGTDTKVTQSYKAYSGYTYWRPLVIGYSSGSSEGFTPTDQTDLVYTFSNLSVQPSSGTIKATVFKGSGASLTSLNGSNISSGTVAVARGGTGLGSYVAGDILYASASTTLSALGGNTTTTTKFLKSVASTAGTADAPEWSTIASTDISDFSTAVNVAKVQIVRLNVSGGDS